MRRLGQRWPCCSRRRQSLQQHRQLRRGLAPSLMTSRLLQAWTGAPLSMAGPLQRYAWVQSGQCDECVSGCRLQAQLEAFDDKWSDMDQHTQKLLADSAALWLSHAGQTQQTKPA